jgi:UDP-N-acetylmuramoyl-L-alanyl-D-glutamate--2,6-diaminopimelate ligase
VDASARISVSLKQLFPQSQMVGADDVICAACDQHPESPMTDWVFAAGVSDWTQPDLDVATAIAHGACGILTEQLLPSSVPQCIVPNIRDAYARLSMALANQPCEKILTIGVVGTHGKTSSALMVASMLKKIGNRVAYMTSLGGSDGKSTGLPADPCADAMSIAQWLERSVGNETPAAVIEISDEMLQSHAACGVEFDVIVFTSLRKSQRTDTLQSRGIEHAMSKLLHQLKSHGVVVYNADDARLNRWMARNQPAAISYGLDADADVSGRRMRSHVGEQSAMVSVGNCVAPLTSTILGDHNMRHMLSAIAVGYSLGLELYETVQGVERLQRIPGRMQRVPGDIHCRVYVDAADQADRLAVALHSLSNDGTPVVCVAEVPDAATPEQLSAFGRVLERAASYVILTQSRRSVRFGQKAIWQVLDGCERPAAVQIVPNRKAAIDMAIRSARPGEAILLAGWGANRWTNDQSPDPQTDLEVANALLVEFAHEPAPEEAAVAVQPALRVFRGRSA